MGNKHSLGCCYYNVSPQPQRKVNDVSDRRVLEAHEPCRAESTTNLQHISEREPEDWQSDPSLHPKAETIFMERSRAAIHGINNNCYKFCLFYIILNGKLCMGSTEGLERRRSQLQVNIVIDFLVCHFLIPFC